MMVRDFLRQTKSFSARNPGPRGLMLGSVSSAQTALRHCRSNNQPVAQLGSTLAPFSKPQLRRRATHLCTGSHLQAGAICTMSSKAVGAMSADDVAGWATGAFDDATVRALREEEKAMPRHWKSGRRTGQGP